MPMNSPMKGSKVIPLKAESKLIFFCVEIFTHLESLVQLVTSCIAKTPHIHT